MRWLFDLDEERERAIVAAVEESGTSSTSYYILLALSTVIASFGLMANSTATVIGAMIVAPLMGPILGLGLGLVRGDTHLVRRALWAEAVGVSLVLATSAGIALVVGPENVDFSVGEIVGRTRPTLFDMAIGLAAGLVGAYATLNPRVSTSIAGVAIAVALVPPLAVSGLAMAGSLHHEYLGHYAFESFMLFLANFLTIELAAVMLFLAAGLGHLGRIMRERSLSTAIVLTLVALVGTASFLYVQLRTLVRERSLREETRAYLSSRVPTLIPGATVADLVVTLNPGALKVDVAARASQEITPTMVAQMAKDLRVRLGLQEGVRLDLVVGTGLYTYVSPTGRLYAQQAEPDPAEVLNQRVDQVLRAALEVHPKTELVEWQRQSAAVPGQVVVTVRSPYAFDAWLVGDLQRAVNRRLTRLDPSSPPLTLTVRTILSQDFTAEGSAQTSLSDLSGFQNRRRVALDRQVRERMSELVDREPRARLLGVQIAFRMPEGPASPEPSPTSPEISPSPVVTRGPGPDPTRIDVMATVRTPRLLTAKQVLNWQERMEKELKLPVRLSVENLLGEVLTPPVSGVGPGIPDSATGRTTASPPPRKP